MPSAWAAAVVPGSAFSGRIRYETRAPDSAGPASADWLFDDGTAALELQLGSVLYATDLGDPFVTIALLNYCANALTGQPTTCLDPSAVVVYDFSADSVDNVLVNAVGYEMGVAYTATPPPAEVPVLDLPEPAALLADQLVGGSVSIDAGNLVSGTITSAVAVPEPGTIALLFGGLIALALRRPPFGAR